MVRSLLNIIKLSLSSLESAILLSNNVSDTLRISQVLSSVNVWISARLFTLLLTVFILLAFSNVIFRAVFFEIIFLFQIVVHFFR